MSQVKISHRMYGCECGCCGHAIFIDGVEKTFAMEAPDDAGQIKAWAIDLADFHLSDADLEGADLENIDTSEVVPKDKDNC